MKFSLFVFSALLVLQCVSFSLGQPRQTWGPTKPPGFVPPTTEHEWGFNPQVNGYGWVFKKDATKGAVVAGIDKPVTGTVTSVWFSPHSGQVGIDIADAEYKNPTSIIVLTGDPDSKVTIDGKPATGAELIAFLYRTDRPAVKAVRERMRYGAVLKADFTTR